jgi:outer membrane protein OmpA-like peptidoglycan-associated protein
MEDHNNISDAEIRKLLKQRLLEHADDDLLEAEAKMVFAAAPVVVPPAAKEKLLIKKLGAKGVGLSFTKWILPGIGVITVAAGVFYYTSVKMNNTATATAEKTNNVIEQPVNKKFSGDQPEELTADTDTSRSNYIKRIPRSMYRGQIIEKILKENADCATPIIVRDTIVFSPHTPKGFGKDLEIHDNPQDDLMYFENEHNTVWYKFSALETGQLTFDIIPVDPNDDYDFMLYKWLGDDFSSKVMNKSINPFRTCISRNDKKLQSKTGLLLNESLPLYVHSGEGASYVKYINVKKGETFYLLVDNVYNNGSGHTIKFHYKPVKPGDLFVGQKIRLSKIIFLDGMDKFKPGTNYKEGLDSLYEFLTDHPALKIEIQGHVNRLPSSTVKTKKDEESDLDLSRRRAIAIYNIMIERGIDPERLTRVGYGTSRKIIQLPKNQKECYVNIRAEIMILSLDYKKESE